MDRLAQTLFPDTVTHYWGALCFGNAVKQTEMISPIKLTPLWHVAFLTCTGAGILPTQHRWVRASESSCTWSPLLHCWLGTEVLCKIHQKGKNEEFIFLFLAKQVSILSQFCLRSVEKITDDWKKHLWGSFFSSPQRDSATENKISKQSQRNTRWFLVSLIISFKGWDGISLIYFSHSCYMADLRKLRFLCVCTSSQTYI